MYSCPYGSDTENPLSLKKEDMIKYITEECLNFKLECMSCKLDYKRVDFFNENKHDCIKNLK